MSSSLSSSSSSSKKVKTDDFEVLKKYILECPHLSNNNPMIKAALDGIEQERKRQERDVKLRQKFSATASTTTTPSTSSTNFGVDVSVPSLPSVDSDVVVVEKAVSTLAGSSMMGGDDIEDDDAIAMEWQDVKGGASSSATSSQQATSESDQQEESNNSYLGTQLAKEAIDAVSKHKVNVQTPVGAIAVALHAALRSDMLGFACTGVPLDESKSSGGFAPPIRELPKSQFLPNNWEPPSSSSSSPTKVELRYRKNGTGACVLSVQPDDDDDDIIHIHLDPARTTPEPSSQVITVPLEKHVNLDSWNTAKQQQSRVPPALHYKGLSILMTKFCQTFDLGAIDSGDCVTQAPLPYVDTTASTSTPNHPTIIKSDFVPQIVLPVGGATRNNSEDGRRPWEVPSTVAEAFPHRPHGMPGGDFASDLGPNINDPLRIGPPRMGGNLMGPNHPNFMGGDGRGGVGMPGGMQPRFDPFGPPGGPQEIDPLGGRGVPRRRQMPGEPNPDHLRPPTDSLGGNMFL